MEFAFIFKSILLGVGLAMDASAVSMTNGLKHPKMSVKMIFFISFLFALFQMVMPSIGYLCGSIFTGFISTYLPWVSLILLSFIGVKMLYEGIKGKEDENGVCDLSIKLIVIQAFATAIDALSIGVIMVNYASLELLISLLSIGIVTFVLSFLSVHIGRKFGDILNHKAEIIGGIILIAIGLEIFITSFF